YSTHPTVSYPARGSDATVREKHPTKTSPPPTSAASQAGLMAEVYSPDLALPDGRQGIMERRRAAVPLLRPLRQRREDDRRERIGHVGVQRARVGGRLLEVLGDQRPRRVGLEGEAAGETLEQH